MRAPRMDKLAAGFRVRGEIALEPSPTQGPQPACVQVRRPGLERLELTPDEAEDLANALLAEAAFARGES